VKREQLNTFSAWEFVGNDISKAVADWEGEPQNIAGNDIVAVITVAICPRALEESLKDEKVRELSKVFAAFYATYPDCVLHLIEVARKRWNDDSVTARIQKHLLTKAYHARPIMKDGRAQQGEFHHEVKDTDTQAAVIGAKQKLEKASDPDAAKKARQRIQEVDWRPMISPELNGALQELKARGLNVGLG